MSANLVKYLAGEAARLQARVTELDNIKASMHKMHMETLGKYAALKAGQCKPAAKVINESGRGTSVVINHWLPVGTELYTQAPTIPEVTSEMCSAGISAYEDAMGGDRLPDGEGYDAVVVTAIFEAMLSAAPQPTEEKV